MKIANENVGATCVSPEWEGISGRADIPLGAYPQGHRQVVVRPYGIAQGELHSIDGEPVKQYN